MAARLRWGPGTPWSFHIQVIGDHFRMLDTKLYEVHLRDKARKKQTLMAAGVDTISSLTTPPLLQDVKKFFPNVSPKALCHLSGEINLLIGACDR